MEKLYQYNQIQFFPIPLSPPKLGKAMAKITINAMKDGPCIVKVDGQRVAALCRCNSSANKPHCDGSHAKSGFKADEAQIDVWLKSTANDWIF